MALFRPISRGLSKRFAEIWISGGKFTARMVAVLLKPSRLEVIGTENGHTVRPPGLAPIILPCRAFLGPATIWGGRWPKYPRWSVTGGLPSPVPMSGRVGGQIPHVSCFRREHHLVKVVWLMIGRLPILYYDEAI